MMKTFQIFGRLLCGGVAILATWNTGMAQHGGGPSGRPSFAVSHRGGMNRPAFSTSNRGGSPRPTASIGNRGGSSQPTASMGNRGGSSRPTASTSNRGGSSQPTASRGNRGGSSRPTASRGNRGGSSQPTASIGDRPGSSRPGEHRPNLPGQSGGPRPSAGDRIPGEGPRPSIGDRIPSENRGPGGIDQRLGGDHINRPEMNHMEDHLYEAGRHMDPDRFVDRGDHFRPDPHHDPDFYRPGHPGYWDRRAYRPAPQWVTWADNVRIGLYIGTDTYHAYRWYNHEWWGYHPPVVMPWWHYHRCWDRYPTYYWWQAPSWSGVVAWFPDYGWNEPVYYEYGTGGNVIYQDNRVFVNGQDIGTIDTYRESAVELATPELPEPALSVDSVLKEDADTEWLALGTFAMVTDKGEKVDPEHCFALQLAVNQDGLLSGTFCDPNQPDQTFAVQGRVDQKTQRVAFTIDGLDQTVFESGIYNLTQEETPLLVHDATRTLKSYLLVRLDDPNTEKTDTNPTATPNAAQTSRDAGAQHATLPLIGPK